MNRLRVTSLMSDNEYFIFAAIVEYLQDTLAVPIDILNQEPWKYREQLLDEGQIDIAWICGLPYTARADDADPTVELLVAPIMRDIRYEGRAVYFSDVVVHQDSDFHEFSDLRGAYWCYNEPNSHSGYNVVRHHLATIGERTGYFCKVVESGSHLASLNLILRHDIDASAIDSIVLGIERQNHPEVNSQLRVIETLGPSPVPPLVVSTKLPFDVRVRLREALVTMNRHPAGLLALAKGQMARLAVVHDSDYDPIRRMARNASGVVL